MARQPADSLRTKMTTHTLTYPAPPSSFACLGSLKPLLAAVNRVRTRSEIAEQTICHTRQLFRTRSCGVILADQDGRRGNDSRGDGVTESQYDDYESYIRPHDAVFAAAVARQVPVRLEQIWSEEEARASIVYREFGRKWDIYHYIAVPLYSPSGMIGVINLSRSDRYPTFSDAEFSAAAALGGYISAAFAQLTHLDIPGLGGGAPELTPRERQVATLVAHGSSNPEIAATLGIARETVKQTLRRVYRKLDVRGRAEMVARLVHIR
jgi:DNA-binding CsgD family transcriptional regulator